ncbi:MAG: DoxX family protein [Proteobacteria bacterium]|nr:DoxX family protein [Pseudomonadota bacterium]
MNLDKFLDAQAKQADLAARVLISAMFLIEGFTKFGNYEGVQRYMEAAGVPGILLPLVIAAEILGALAVIVGWQARWAALALAGFCILTAVFFHTDFGDFNQKIHFMKNLAIAGGFLFLVARGPGPWSLDARRAAARDPAP